jgi:hypothetical protein
MIMKKFYEKFSKVQVMRGLRAGLLSVFLMSAFSITSFAEGDGPSLDNLKKNASEGAKELAAIREKQAHDEFMSYVYMVVGFSIVIAIAWITTVKARKRSAAENEAKMKFIQQNLAKKHAAHGHHGGHTLHKARR